MSNLLKDRQQLFFYLVFFFLVLWSLFTLSYSPLVWVDEAILASYTHSFIEGNGISMELDHGDFVPLYGPVFFLIQTCFIKIIGFSPFGFRLCNCVFAFLSIIVFGKLLGNMQIRKDVTFFFMLLFATDVLFVSNSHSGRMEFVALFFVLLAYWAYFKTDGKDGKKALAISLVLTLSFMTTPRIAVIAIPIAVAELYRLLKKRMWLTSTFYVLIPVLLYYLWILYAFGSINSMLDYYLKPSQTSPDASLVDRFVSGGTSLFIPKWQIPLIVTSVLCVVHSICNRYFGRLLLFITPICLFYILVVDTGTYSILIIPFYLLIICGCVAEIMHVHSSKWKRIIKFALLCCIVLNGGIFLFKGANVICTLNTRDHEAMSTWLKKNVPVGSKLAGTYAFYYAAVDNDCPYRRLEHEYLNAKGLHDDLLNNYKVEYLIVSEDQLMPEMKKCFPLFQKEIRKVASYKPVEGDSWANRMFRLVLKKYPILSNYPTYACNLYKVEKI